MAEHLYERPLAPPAWLVLLLLSLAGAGGWAVSLRATEGLSTTNLTGHVVWGLWVACYIYFIGLSAGSFLLSTLIFVFRVHAFEKVGRLAIFSALALFGTGLGLILLDLGHMERFVTVYTHRSWTSVLSWEIHLYAVYLLLLLAELYLLLRIDLVELRDNPRTPFHFVYRLLALGSIDTSEKSRRRDQRIVTALGLLGIPVALGVHGGTGAIFAVAKARPYWFTGLFPIVFIVSALASGAGLLTVLFALTGDRRDRDYAPIVLALGRMAAGALAFDLLLLSSELLVDLYSGIPERIQVHTAIMAGPYAWLFWGQVGVGGILPIALVASPATRGRPSIVAAAAACIFLGIFGVRLNLVVPSQTVPMLPGLHEAFLDQRASAFYFPSWIEVLSTVGVLAINASLYVAGFCLLPLYDRHLANLDEALVAGRVRFRVSRSPQRDRSS